MTAAERASGAVRPIALLTLTSPSTAVGGVETFTTALSHALQDVEVVALNQTEGRSVLLRLARYCGLSEPARALAVARKFQARHRQANFSCVICNGMTGWLFWFQRPGIPTVCVFHGNYAGYVRSVTAPRSLQRMRGLLWAQFEKLAARAATHVIAVSSSVEEDVRTYYGRQATTIHNSPDEATFWPGSMADARRELGLPETGDVALFVGRATPAKGFDVLRSIAAALPGTLFVCAVPDAPATVAANMRIVERPAPAVLRSLYQAATYVVAPSQFEGCSYVPLEALACGRPVVTSATGVFRFNAPVDGVQVVQDARSVEAFVAAIAALDARREVPSLPASFTAAAFGQAYAALVAGLGRASYEDAETSCAS